MVICDFAFMLPPESAFCSNHDRKRTFLGCVHAYLRRQNQRFETLIQNADSKRPFTEYCSCFPREEDDFVSMHCALFEAIVRAQVNRKGVYMTSLNVVICDFAFMLPPESAFCSNHDRKRTFWAF